MSGDDHHVADAGIGPRLALLVAVAPVVIVIGPIIDAVDAIRRQRRTARGA